MRSASFLKASIGKSRKCQLLSHVRLFANPDCSSPGSSVRGILQARIPAWQPFPTSGDLPDPGIKPLFPSLQEDSLPCEPPRMFRYEWDQQSFCLLSLESRFPFISALQNSLAFCQAVKFGKEQISGLTEYTHF